MVDGCGRVGAPFSLVSYHRIVNYRSIEFFPTTSQVVRTYPPAAPLGDTSTTSKPCILTTVPLMAEIWTPPVQNFDVCVDYVLRSTYISQRPPPPGTYVRRTGFIPSNGFRPPANSRRDVRSLRQGKAFLINYCPCQRK